MPEFIGCRDMTESCRAGQIASSNRVRDHGASLQLGSENDDAELSDRLEYSKRTDQHLETYKRNQAYLRFILLNGKFEWLFS